MQTEKLLFFSTWPKRQDYRFTQPRTCNLLSQERNKKWTKWHTTPLECLFLLRFDKCWEGNTVCQLDETEKLANGWLRWVNIYIYTYIYTTVEIRKEHLLKHCELSIILWCWCLTRLFPFCGKYLVWYMTEGNFVIFTPICRFLHSSWDKIMKYHWCIFSFNVLLVILFLSCLLLSFLHFSSFPLSLFLYLRSFFQSVITSFLHFSYKSMEITKPGDTNFLFHYQYLNFGCLSTFYC